MFRVDVAIAGAGIAGAGLAAAIAPYARVVLVEAEDQPGAHATGRSAAFWTETYGGPLVRPLTTASLGQLRPFLRPRGALHLARGEDAHLLADMRAAFAGAVELRPVDPRHHVRHLREAWSQGLYEPSCADIDVAALHAALLARAKRAGAVLRLGEPIRSAIRVDGHWRINDHVVADVLVNAAGAWADALATLAGVRPVGIRSYRRTIVQLRTDPPAPAELPLVLDARGRFYFKPDAGGRLWLSPHDETPADPGDAQPEEIDVATAIDRLHGVVDWRVEAVERRWAGLRSFSPDRLPVYGHDRSAPGFFWCAGQGGFGIQTAPAASAMAAALLLGHHVEGEGIDPARYSPDRFQEDSRT